MQTDYILWEYFINFLEVVLFYILMQSKLTLKKDCAHIQTKQFIYLLLRWLILCVLNMTDFSSMVILAISYAIEVGFALIFYDDAFLIRFFWGSMYTVICLVADYITLFIPQTFSHITSPDLLMGGALRMPFSLLYIALTAVLVFLLHCMSDRKIQLSVIQKISYFVICISGIIIGHYIMVITLEAEKQFHDPDFTSKLVLVNLVFLILFLFLLLYIYQLGDSKAVNTALLEKQRLHELEEMEYKTLINTTEALREMKHDINIHLDVIQSLAANGKSDDLQTYINNYHHSLAQTHHLLSTGNTAIDCILSNKLDAAQKLDIQTEFSVLLPSNFSMDPLALSSLIGNMWNNALEACQRLQNTQPDTTPFIYFFIKPFQHMTLIHMENNYDSLIQQNGYFLSLKKDDSHGIGIKRMEDIVNEAGGIFQISTEDHIFTVHIMIPLKEAENEANNFNS